MMDTVGFNRVAFPSLVVAFLGLIMVFPAMRLRRRTGKWPFALRPGPQRSQELIGWVFAGMMTGFCAWGVLYASLGPEPLGVWRTPVALHVLGWSTIAAAFVVAMAAQARMGASWRMGIDPGHTELVVGGIFSFSRNPMYTSLLIGLLGAVLVSPAVWTLAGWIVTAGTLAIQVRAEERHMLTLHGERYRAYAARVGRFFPRVGRPSSGRRFPP